MLIVYDTERVAGATAGIASCLARALEEVGAEARVCRAREGCPDPSGYDLVIVGSPIYYERPLPEVISFLDRHGGLEGVKVAVFITCLAASERIPSFIREAITRKYLAKLLNRVRAEVVSTRVFKGWLRRPDPSIVAECRRWCTELLSKGVHA